MPFAKDLSVIVPGNNEQFMEQTARNILANAKADTEVICVCDGGWPEPPVRDDKRIHVIHFTKAVGQRAATNAGASLSRAKYVMKIDAHCSVSRGFDVQLMKTCRPDWTMVPMMYNLHAFDWKCKSCGNRTYQGYEPEQCEKCNGKGPFEKVVVWRPKRPTRTVSWRFDKDLLFQYWRHHCHRPECKGDLVETMSFIGACMFLERKRFWDLGGMDEGHGSWGQFGTEWACKSWLSGGKLVTDKKCWFAHMFRTGNFAKPGRSSWPYRITQGQIDRARRHSRDMWQNGKWPLAKRKLDWLVEKFSPVPGWHEDEHPIDKPKADRDPHKHPNA